VAGAGKLGTAENPCAYERIAAAINIFPSAALAEDGGMCLTHHWDHLAAMGSEKPDEYAPMLDTTLPDWFSAPVATPARPTAPLAPSGLGGAHIVPGAEGQESEAALAYGSTVHNLLESLILESEFERQHLLAALDPTLPEQAEVLALMNTQAMQSILSTNPMAEVGFTANIAGLGPLAGRIDLLQIAPDCVTVHDFKTNRTVPPSPAETPEALLRQMGAYRAALAQIYPKHRIETALIWTQTAQIMPLDENLTEAALARAIAERAAP